MSVTEYRSVYLLRVQLIVLSTKSPHITGGKRTRLFLTFTVIGRCSLSSSRHWCLWTSRYQFVALLSHLWLHPNAPSFPLFISILRGKGWHSHYIFKVQIYMYILGYWKSSFVCKICFDPHWRLMQHCPVSCIYGPWESSIFQFTDPFLVVCMIWAKLVSSLTKVIWQGNRDIFDWIGVNALARTINSIISLEFWTAEINF